MEFDDKFLQEMGLMAMPEGERQKFLDYIREELEIRIALFDMSIKVYLFTFFKLYLK